MTKYWRAGAKVVLFADAGERIGATIKRAEFLEIDHVMHNDRMWVRIEDTGSSIFDRWTQVTGNRPE